MNMTGEQRIAAPRQRVWEALNDPEILRASIPGCQSLTKESDTRFTATVEVKAPAGTVDDGNRYIELLGSAGLHGSVGGFDGDVERHVALGQDFGMGGAGKGESGKGSGNERLHGDLHLGPLHLVCGDALFSEISMVSGIGGRTERRP